MQPHRVSWSGHQLRVGTMVSMAIALVMGLAALIADGSQALLGVVVGSCLVYLFFASGNLVAHVALVHPDGVGMTAMLVGYLVRLGLFVALGVFAARQLGCERPSVAGWFAAAMVLGTVAWLGGLVAVDMRSRHPVYDSDYRAKEHPVRPANER